MGFLKPDINTQQPKSQATPLSQDVLNLLRQAIAGGNMGSPMSASGKEAESSLSGFIKDRQSPEMFNELMGPLREAFGLQTEKDVAKTREGMSAMGNRFGTPMLREEGRVRNEANIGLNDQISRLFLGEQANLLKGIGMQGDMAAQNLQPFYDFAGLGILPENQFVTDNPWMTLISELIKAGGMAAGGGA
jgi:hypothetical protein